MTTIEENPKCEIDGCAAGATAYANNGTMCICICDAHTKELEALAKKQGINVDKYVGPRETGV